MRRAALVLILALGAVAPALAVAPGCDRWLPPPYEGNEARVRSIDVPDIATGLTRRVFVLVPPGYDESSRRYPTIYLMHGGVNTPDAWLTMTDLIDFTSRLLDEDQAIVLMPDGTLAPSWADWRNGVRLDESLFTDVIVPTIDSTFRTIPDGGHRAIAGFSAGGLGALRLAARHPDLFTGVGAFSPLANVNPERGTTGIGGAALVYGAGTAIGYCYGDLGDTDPFGMFGDPVVEPVWIRNGNPADLAPNFGTLSVTMYSGNGSPCDAVDVVDLTSRGIPGGPTSPPWVLVEPGAEGQASDLSSALTEAGVDHTWNRGVCGIHTYRHVTRYLHDWWSIAVGTFGTPEFRRFDFRTADETFSVHGWTVGADPARAPEFLDVDDASCAGAMLTGSGETTVTTAGCFSTEEVITLMGAVEPTAIADAAGRITFHVDLGPAHPNQQYTPVARALEAIGGYWTTGIVTFGPTS